MSEYIFLVGEDYESNNKEYIALNTDKGQQINIALAASSIPFKGRFEKDRILFAITRNPLMKLLQNLPRTNMLNSVRKSRSIRTVTVFISCLLSLKFCV